MRRRAGLPVGSEAPAFELPSTSGETVSLDDLLADGKPVLLVFTTADCAQCNALMPELAGWQDEYRDDLVFAVVGGGAVEVNRAKAAEHGIRRLLVQKASEVATSYAHFGTPNAVAVSPDRKVASRLAVGVDAIRELVSRTASNRADGPLPPARRRRAMSA
jgi:peroxiredoxin